MAFVTQVVAASVMVVRARAPVMDVCGPAMMRMALVLQVVVLAMNMQVVFAVMPQNMAPVRLLAMML
jgi:hypothetical protein